MQKHTGKVSKCSICSKTFNQRPSLLAHIRRRHSESAKQIASAKSSQKRFKCQYCPSRFKIKEYLETHERRHTREMPFGCPICPKRFLDPNEVKYHIMRHTGEKPYKCTVQGCDKAYIRGSHLTQHLRIHTGERPYKCEVCQKGFRVSTHRLRHEKEVHKFVRPQAPRIAIVPTEERLTPTFATLDFAEQPTESPGEISEMPATKINFNTEKREFCCRICGRSFGKSSHRRRRRHEGSVHSDLESQNILTEIYTAELDANNRSSGTPSRKKRSKRTKGRFKCRLCGKIFGSSSHCRRHERTVHSDKIPDNHRNEIPTVESAGTATTRLTQAESDSSTNVDSAIKESDVKSEEYPVSNVILVLSETMIKNEDIKQPGIHAHSSVSNEETSNSNIHGIMQDLKSESEPIFSTVFTNTEVSIPLAFVYCPYCYISFQSNSELESHGRTSHAVSDGPNSNTSIFNCPHLHCKKKLKSIAELKLHQANIHKLNHG